MRWCESYHVYELHIAKELGLGSSKNVDKKFWTCFLLLLSSFGFCLFTFCFLVVLTRQILFFSKTDSILIGWWILDMIHLKFSLRVEWIMDFVDFIPILYAKTKNFFSKYRYSSCSKVHSFDVLSIYIFYVKTVRTPISICTCFIQCVLPRCAFFS